MCGALAVPRRFACVRRVANWSSGAASQREHNEMPSAKLANDPTPQVLRRSRTCLGTDRARLGLVCCKVRAGQRRGLPTNWQLCSADKRCPGARARGSGASVRAAAGAVHRCAARGLPWEAARTHKMGAICGKVETQGESRKEVEEDLRIDNRKRNSLIFAVIEWVSAVDGANRVKDQEKLARSRCPSGAFTPSRRLVSISP